MCGSCMQLVDASKGEQEGMKGLLSTMAVNQDPEDRRNFLMLVSLSATLSVQ